MDFRKFLTIVGTANEKPCVKFLMLNIESSK